MKKNNILLSIISPVYNTEKTVERMVESLEKQEFKNYELILVNDGSKDKSWEVLQKIEKKYNNVIIINKENSGSGETRNKGLEVAKGKFITFADSDDYYTDDYFEKIIPEIEKENFDLLVFNINMYNKEKFLHKGISEKYKSGEFEEENGLVQYLLGKFSYRILNSPCNKIYVKEIIDKYNLRFTNKRRGQDLIFNMLYTTKIKKYRYIETAFYNYDLDMNSVRDLAYNPLSIENSYAYYDPINKLCVENNIDNWEHYFGLFLLRKLPGIIENETKNPNKKEGLNNLKEYLNNKNIGPVLKKVKFKNMDIKLFICYIIYKFKLTTLIYRIMYRGAK